MRLSQAFHSLLALLVAMISRPQIWKRLVSIAPQLIASSKSGSTFRVSWSQDGEDLFLVDTLKPQGYFVDVGAHHPHRFSNTFLLYQRGWRGLNIDVTDAIVSDFPRLREEDTNYFGLASEKSQVVSMIVFEDSALNSIDEITAAEHERNGYARRGSIEVQAETLEAILRLNDAPDCIDLLCIDTEGHDLSVLKGLDFESRTISHILVETSVPAHSLENTSIGKFLAKFGYLPIACFRRSALFARNPTSLEN